MWHVWVGGGGSSGIPQKALNERLIDPHLHDPRDYASANRHNYWERQLELRATRRPRIACRGVPSLLDDTEGILRHDVVSATGALEPLEGLHRVEHTSLERREHANRCNVAEHQRQARR